MHELIESPPSPVRRPGFWWLVAATGIGTAALELPMWTGSRGREGAITEGLEPTIKLTPTPEKP